MHRQETVECLKKFNARRKLKVWTSSPAESACSPGAVYSDQITSDTFANMNPSMFYKVTLRDFIFTPVSLASLIHLKFFFCLLKWHFPSFRQNIIFTINFLTPLLLYSSSTMFVTSLSPHVWDGAKRERDLFILCCAKHNYSLIQPLILFVPLMLMHNFRII